MRKRVFSVREIMKEFLSNGSRSLVTRDTGKGMREALEERLQAEPEEVVAILDFKAVGILDYSCADEIVAKPISGLNAGEYGIRYLIVRGLNSTQRENIKVALERKHLAALFLHKDKSWEILGVLNNYLKETLNKVMREGRITARDLAEAEDLEINTSGTRLANLYKIQLVRRREELLSEGGRQFVYESFAMTDPYRFIADFHVHSKYSRATSRDMQPETLAKWCEIKGIKVLGTGDFTHPTHFAELKAKLEPQANGLLSLVEGDSRTYFVFTAEVSNIYSEGGRSARFTP